MAVCSSGLDRVCYRALGLCIRELNQENASVQVSQRTLRNNRFGVGIMLLCLVAVACAWCPAHAQPGGDDVVSFGSATIVVDRGQTEPVRHAAEVLKARLQRRSGVPVTVAARVPKGAGLVIHFGQAVRGGDLARLCEEHGVALVGGDKPAPEGYAVKTVALKDSRAILALGADARGALYAVGEILRRVDRVPGALRVGPIDVSTAPAYRFRGFSANQGGTMIKITKARGWTAEERDNEVMNYALAGGNIFYCERHGGSLFDYIKSFDLMSITDARPNELGGDRPEEWQAGGLEPWEGKRWVCPSIPEARAALMANWEQDFARRPQHDVMRMYAGDPGGCRDERCAPWGKTFVHLCEEVAGLWLKDHPNSVVLMANQDLTNAGDQAIFDYLNEKPREWLYAMCYGPGSNAMSDYFRDELRDDLFVYPGPGPTSRYLAETLNQIPKAQRIVQYSDITHWISAQYEVEHPERHLVKAYGRRTFHTRPRAFYRIFQAIMPFSEGDIIYSEGHHDEFHQYMWSRLLWNPHRSLEDVMREYCELHFGQEAAEPMMDALLQLEKNLEAPLETNPGIDRYYLLVKRAGWKMPEYLMENDYRWRLHMQKAALDKYQQLKLRAELAKERGVVEAMQAGLESGELDAALDQAAAILDAPGESPEMAHLRAEAGRLGEETERIHGVRNVGYFKLDRVFRDLPRVEGTVEKARKATAKKEKRRLMEAVKGLAERPTKTG
ncbi:MAG: hypothetical protein GWP08_06100, partial [Nitrospiraceae bacterium]|nr:hypothetical protein [Nitrospiraceae bacterium]